MSGSRAATLAAQRAGAKSDDWAHVILFYGERRVVLHAGMLVAGGSHRFTVHGDKGSIVKHRSDRQEQQLLDGMVPGAPGWGADDDEMISFDQDGEEQRLPALSGDQRLYYGGIVDALRGTSPGPVSIADALTVMAIVEAAAASSASQASVDTTPLRTTGS